MLKTAANLQLLLSHGFTSVFEAASVRADVFVSDYALMDKPGSVIMS